MEASPSPMHTQLVPAVVGLRRGMLPLQRPRSLSPASVARKAAAPAPTGYAPEAIMEQVSPALHAALDALLRDIESKGRVPAAVGADRKGRRSSGSAVIQPVPKASPAEQAECLRFLAQWLLRNKDAQ